MSDDTPTERFPASGPTEPLGAVPLGSAPLGSAPLGSDAPTERFAASDPTRRLPTPAAAAPLPTERLVSTPAAPPRATTPAATTPAEEPKSRALLITLISIGAALLIAIIVLAILLFTRDDSTPVAAPSPSVSVTPTPTPTPTETPTPTPTPTVAPPVVVGPSFDSFTAPTDAGCTGDTDNVDMTFSWASSNATKAYIGVATTNAKEEPFESDLPPVYTFTDLQYQCDQASQLYTVTLEDADGNLAHKTVTVSQ